jgi:hypothetical protein
MSAFRYRLRTLLLAVPVIALCAAAVARWVDAQGILDLTTDSPSTCEVHNVKMSPKLVGLTYGMKGPTPMSTARRALFPHADEIYDSGFCMPIPETTARVYVCPHCTKARSSWLQGQASQ